MSATPIAGEGRRIQDRMLEISPFAAGLRRPAMVTQPGRRMCRIREEFLCKQDVGVAPDRGGTAAQWAVMRILVVDDDRSVRDALRRALTLAGYEVQMAEGGQQALTVAATAVPDAVVLDVGMPDIDGIEVCQRLRRGGNRVPVLML